MRLTREQLDQYDEDGYVIIPDFLSAEEVGVLAADADILGTPRRGLPEGNVYERNSGLIRKSYSFDKDFESYRVLTRLPRMLAPARQILGEDIYLYMTHMNHKMAEKGERWLWHQDYAHWELDGVERGSAHDMVTTPISLPRQHRYSSDNADWWGILPIRVSSGVSARHGEAELRLDCMGAPITGLLQHAVP